MNERTDANQAVSKHTALAVASISSFAVPFMSSSINVALPDIGRVFNLNAVVLGWVATIFLLAAAIFLLPFGKIADIVGRKKIYLYGVISFTAFTAVSALAPNITFLLIARTLQGAGAALIFGTGVAILTSVFPPSERGKALGMNVAFTYTGLSLGPVLGGVLTQRFGWTSVFWVIVPLGVVATILVLWKLKGEWKEAAGEHLDIVGSLVAGSALAVLIYGLSVLPSIAGYTFVFAGIAGIIGFIAWERRARDPVVRLDMFVGNRVFAMSNVAALINYSATFAITFFMSLYLQYIKGMDPGQAGLVLIAQPAMMAIFSPITGRLSDRYQARVLASIGMGMMAVMLFLLSRISPDTPLWFLVPSLLILGIGYALFSSPNANAIMGSV
ncbi:MAG TPA: MFS transporter, partial [Spirochaetia bacterium]|nr:MFS transporter [Spirochaetia bacterium]